MSEQDPHALRARFSAALSALYRREVPLYGTLLELVANTNAATAGLAEPRVEVERHGAIRLGTTVELATMRRLFAVLGMYPVGYYDLSAAGIPVHSTAFRPVDAEALAANPFRVFTSLLRLDLLADAALRDEAETLLAARSIFSEPLLTLIAIAEREGGLPEAHAEHFIAEALQIFRWHGSTTCDRATYDRLRSAHPLVADIACFRGPHINHLTPRTLDIDAAQEAMRARGMRVKAVIEGPPRRLHPILLRQTSFHALDEPVRFRDGDGSHTARFGEIEQRGVALTPKGRALYDRLLAEAEARIAEGADRTEASLQVFAAFPDDAAALRAEGLAFYCPNGTPVTYEDFLPVSAAGIFRSNLGGQAERPSGSGAAQEAFEAALGAPVADPMALYASAAASA